ncbi:hypothetical protein ACIRRA_12365 [Nocardia sp. NPDC101769]|uniref:hypothetical protein n=1 Tax=Nocardia sp. NPDC101769 TaxID=3364333 RepID=UPI0037FDD956
MTAGERARSIDGGTELKRLLREKHWDTPKVFAREYNKTARKINRNLGGLDGPSKAQFYNWLAGNLKGLPQPDHCAVLEAMLPGHTAEELFAPAAVSRGVQKTAQNLPVAPQRPASGEQFCSPVPDGTPDTAGVRDRTLRALRVAARVGDSNESPDSVVGSDRKRSQQEVTAAIDDRLRSLMSWIGETAPLKERDIHRDNVRGPSVEAPARPAVDRRRSR